MDRRYSTLDSDEKIYHNVILGAIIIIDIISLVLIIFASYRYSKEINRDKKQNNLLLLICSLIVFIPVTLYIIVDIYFIVKGD